MSYTNGLDKPTDYFNTVLYTGNGTDNHAITGVGFQPDAVWIKDRDDTSWHQITDAVRGATKTIYPNDTNAETTDTNYVKSFDTDGFTVGVNNANNQSGANNVSWNWLAGGTASSNTDGSITSSVSANTTAGFSIVSYTGTGANATVGHGLGSALACYVVKSRDTAYDWRMYHQGIGETKYLNLNQNIASVTASNAWNDTAPTSSVFSLGSGSTVNQSGDDFIAYCFAEKKGYSKFGSWTGVDGAFLHTGFKPAFILGKNSSNASAYDWWIFDNKRDTFNDGANNLLLRPNGSDAEATFTFAKVDFLSNGFKIYGTDLTVNGSGDTMIYMAFAESPFVSSTGIPTTAR